MYNNTKYMYYLDTTCTIIPSTCISSDTTCTIIPSTFIRLQ